MSTESPSASVSMEERRVPLYKLLAYAQVLAHMDSFSKNISGANFDIRTGYLVKPQIETHRLDDHPVTLRGDEALGLYHITVDDVVILTEAQYFDYRIVIGYD